MLTPVLLILLLFVLIALQREKTDVKGEEERGRDDLADSAGDYSRKQE